MSGKDLRGKEKQFDLEKDECHKGRAETQGNDPVVDLGFHTNSSRHSSVMGPLY